MQAKFWASNRGINAVIFTFAALLTVGILVEHASEAVDHFFFPNKHRALMAKKGKDKSSNGDDEDDHEKQGTKGDTSEEDDTSSKQKGVQKVYDASGWHLPPDGFVTKVMHPEELQPFYIMPIFFAIKLILTMTVFGFTLKFKKKNPSCFDTPAYIAKIFAGLAFIFMALNGYYHDFMTLQGAEKHVDSFAKQVGVFFIVWATSSNYVACRAVWNSLAVENPVYLLSLTPKYPACLFGVPLVPCTAKWLDPLRHIYALILLPYFAPYVAFQIGLSFVLCCWFCATKCAVAIGQFWGVCSFGWALCLTIITLGFWPWARNALGFWWGMEQPVYYFVMVQIWATAIAPMLFTMLYGCVNGVSCENVFKGAAAQQVATQVPVAPGAPAPSPIELSDRVALYCLNEEMLKDDFDGAPVNDEEQGDANEKQDLDDAKVTIFFNTLSKMSSIVAEQMFLIFMVRALTSAHNYDEYIGTMVKTMTERTWATYSAHLMNLATATKTKALNTIWLLI